MKRETQQDLPFSRSVFIGLSHDVLTEGIISSTRDLVSDGVIVDSIHGFRRVGNRNRAAFADKQRHLV